MRALRALVPLAALVSSAICLGQVQDQATGSAGALPRLATAPAQAPANVSLAAQGLGVLHGKSHWIPAAGVGCGGADASEIEAGYGTFGNGQQRPAEDPIADGFVVAASETRTFGSFQRSATSTGASTVGSMTHADVCTGSGSRIDADAGASEVVAAIHGRASPGGCSDGPTIYCTAKPNSRGCLPQIATAGFPELGGGSGFTISVANVINQKFGWLLYGIWGADTKPFAGGTLCVQGATSMAFPKQTPFNFSAGSSPPASDCSGVWSIDFKAFALGALGGTPLPQLAMPCVPIWAQWYGQDPASTPQPFTLSDAVHFTFGP